MSADDPNDKLHVGDDGEIPEQAPGADVDWYGSNVSAKAKRSDPRTRRNALVIATTAVTAACLAVIASMALLSALGVLQIGPLLCRVRACATPTAANVALYATPNIVIQTLAPPPSDTPVALPMSIPTLAKLLPTAVSPTNPVVASASPGSTPATEASKLCFSRNGANKEKIVFASDRNSQREIDPFDLYAMDTDGSNVCRLTTRGGEQPAVSYDGEMIAFTSQRSGQSEIFYMPVRDHINSQIRITSGPLDAYPMWEPGFGGIPYILTYTGDPQKDNRAKLYVIGLGSGKPSEIPVPGDSTTNFDGQWAPDRQHIVFASTRDGSTDIYTIDNHFANLRPLTVRLGVSGSPAWSPDSKRVVFVSERDKNLNIYVINADGSELRPLTNGPGLNAEARWSPDGKHIVFMSDRDGNQEIYTMDGDGTNVRRLTFSPAKDRMPTWSRCVDVSYEPAQCQQ